MNKNNQNLSLAKDFVFDKTFAIKTTAFISLSLTATFLPSLIHVQFVTGPIVNAILFFAAAYLGVQAALLIGLIPSLIALSSGLLPAVLAPMVPFIMFSNALLIIIFSLLKKRNYWAGVISASLIKFVFLFSTSSVVINLLIKKEIAAKVAAMMSWPQLLTALAGGIIAWIILKGFKMKEENEGK